MTAWKNKTFHKMEKIIKLQNRGHYIYKIHFSIVFTAELDWKIVIMQLKVELFSELKH